MEKMKRYSVTVDEIDHDMSSYKAAKRLFASVCKTAKRVVLWDWRDERGVRLGDFDNGTFVRVPK